MLEAASECPVCLDKMWDGSALTRFVCCGNQICKKCEPKGESGFKTCPICRKEAPRSVAESLSIMKEKADLGIAWAQADMGHRYLTGDECVQKDVEKAFSLFSEAAEKGSTEAKRFFGEYYFQDANYEEARRWLETAAAEGDILALFQLGMLMKRGQAFDQNEQTRKEAFRLLTISATLYEGPTNLPAKELSFFFRDSYLPVMLHYLRPIVEGGDASLSAMDHFALGLMYLSEDYYGEDIIWEPGHNPIPEALFWHRRSSRTEEPDADHPLNRLERKIRGFCANCREDLPEGKQSCCVECKAAYYCSRDCQMAHWKEGHKKDCAKKLKKRLRAEGKL